MKPILLGEADGQPFTLSPDRLVKTRLLVQGGSGSGKSWLCRRIAEQLFGSMPVLIIDPEGEFASLREQFGFVLVGPGGETPADPRSATMVATKLLELHASAVCDIYELSPEQRSAWVAGFLAGLIDAPKSLWRQLVIIVDEAHMFCPERGFGESAATDGMIALATRGRKRGFVPIFATQRMSKMRKDAIAELQNVLIGRTFIHLDRERAIDTLGVPRSERDEFTHQLKTLKSGEFWAFGPALSMDRTRVTIGPVQTTHPTEGGGKQAKRALTPPPAPEAVKALLPQLADLPEAAEREATTVAELRRKVSEQATTIRHLERAPPAAAGKPVSILLPDDRKTIKALAAHLARVPLVAEGVLAHFKDELQTALQTAAAGGVFYELEQKLVSAGWRRTLERLERISVSGMAAAPAATAAIAAPSPAAYKPPLSSESIGPGVKQCERAILRVLGQHGPQMANSLTLLSGYRWTGGFQNSLATLRKLGLMIGGNAEAMSLTEAGQAAAGTLPPLPVGAELQAYWLHHPSLKKMERAQLAAFVAAGRQGLTADALSTATNYQKSGGFFNALANLRRAHLISGKNTETMRAVDALLVP